MTIKREPRLYKGQGDWAGRVDVLAECCGEWEGVRLDGLYVLDYKSSKEPSSPTGYDEWPLQIAGYIAGTIQTYPKVYPTGGAMVRLDKETGLPQIYDYTDIWKEALVRFEYLARYYRETYSDDLRRGIPSVTTILNILSKPALIQWAANMACEYIISQADDLPEWQGITATTVKMWAEDAKKNYRRVSSKAANIGVEVHRLVELDSKGKPLPKMEHVSPAVENGYEAYCLFREAVNLKPLKIEYNIYGKFMSHLF